MWRAFRVRGIQAPLFWPLAFFCLGLFAWDDSSIAFIASISSLGLWMIFPAFRMDLSLSFACVLAGWVRMELHDAHHPLCTEETVDLWVCHCPHALDAACCCVSQSTLQSWDVEIKDRNARGTTRSFWGQLAPFKSHGNFDVAQWKYSQNIAGEIIPLQSITMDTSIAFQPTVFDRLRQSIRGGFQLHFRTDAESLLLAVFLGDKSSLSKTVKQAFSHSGIAHVLAVSGYHIGLVGMGPFLLIRNRRRWLRVLGMACFPVVWLYVLLCHAPVSAVRAAIMSTAYILGTQIRRSISPFQCWALAGLIVLIWKPHAAMALGTQLSFAAVAAILLFLKAMRAFNRDEPWAMTTSIPVAAQLGTLGWTANAFGTFPLAFWPMNILVAPFMSILGFSTMLWLALHRFASWTNIANGIAEGVSIMVFQVFKWLVHCDEQLNWAPSISHWNPLVWPFISGLFFAWSLLVIAQPKQRQLWSMRCLMVSLFILPWLGPWIV
jgi:ComEC/Rec2-related protein